MAEEQSSATKVAGDNKKVMSNIKSLSTFPVSEAANAATAVSRKRSLADRILLFEFSGQVLFPCDAPIYLHLCHQF